jgi:cell division protein FtsB
LGEIVVADNIISLSDLIEQRLRKQQEIDYYRNTLVKLERKIRELDKEVDITTLIIDMIETERVLTIDEKLGKVLLLNDKKRTT